VSGGSISETTTGLVAEYIAAAAILERGWRVSMAQQDRVDLVAWRGEILLRVQVKGAKANNRGDYQFQLGSGSKKKSLPSKEHYDVVALVGIHQRRTLFMPVEAVQQYTKRIRLKRFEDPLIEIDSWQKTMEAVNAGLE
jgi:hypothetical protein